MSVRPPGNGPILAGMMVDLKADARPGPWPDQALLREGWRPAWRDWLLLAVFMSLLVSVIALLLWLP
jgi:hypothetical protein